MGELLRAPEAVGSWEWFVDTGGKAGIFECLSTIAAVAEIFHRHALLKVEAVEICWEHPRNRRADICKTIPVSGAIDTPEYAQSLLASRSGDTSDAQLKLLRAHGGGTWIDVQGNAHTEADLILLETMPLFDDVATEVAVHHDVWARYAFSGAPHPEVHAANAPRLAAALKEVESTLRSDTSPGEPTYFGAVEGYGIQAPEPYEIVDGRAPDLTDRID
ncbi:hypothetical protein VSQ78_03760 [Nocardiopsis alba]|uniref:Uncharacterized protein n=1 Tax=Nocardiopsis alba TaxID=53437 RepID=A0ABV5DQD9_9ACTN